MKTLMLSLAVLAALGTAVVGPSAFAGPNETCTGENCPKKPKDNDR